ncbi:MAG: calcium-binding protein [Sulfitobacter sp.]|nr:calcium-binding protein [Sulfitobacter sp.]
MATKIEGTKYSEAVIIGSGAQAVSTGAGNDRIISYADGGEPDPAQTPGAEGRVYAPITESANDTLTGGAGRDTFEFRALINAKEEVITAHTGSSGQVNWGNVAGENDNVHDHWVEGFGTDTITDFSKEEGDKIKITGHTVTIGEITYGTDEAGAYSLITVYSQQGDGGAGGANTATGAHDEDPLGLIKVYGDRVELADLEVDRNNEGIDRVQQTDAALAPIEGGITQIVSSNTDDTNYTGSVHRQTDRISLGEGSQTVDAGGGNDVIYSYSDGGEPDPAQTDGADGRVNDLVAASQSDDMIAGGQGSDLFAFRLLLNAKQEILDKHTREDGSVNWRKVAGENDNVHDHWVEGIGNDVILDFSNQDRDKIEIRGHTVEIAAIEYGEDAGGDFSLILLRSQQGDGGGAHDEDPLGTIKVYGDKVTEDDISLRADVFYGVDELDEIAADEASGLADNARVAPQNPQWGMPNPEEIEVKFAGTSHSDMFKAGSGTQHIDGGAGNDKIISYGDAGEPDPAQTEAAGGRINPALSAGASDDFFSGGAGADHFEFRALLNATAQVAAQHTGSTGFINWRGVAGENDNVHDHWVEGFGTDTILDYSKDDGDKITVRGHTVEIAEITYGEDEGGAFSVIRVISQQGDGGAGGANTATGAHDEDPLGIIKVYGDKVTDADVRVQASGVFDGADRLTEADELLGFNGGVQEFVSTEHGEVIETAPGSVETADRIEIGSGAQEVHAGVGRDHIRIYADGGEPDPAQTDGAGRINDPVDPSLSTDIISGGQDRDHFKFNFLLNATEVVLARHTEEDGSINWRKVAGENDAVHDHWVESGGNDVLLDFSNQDGDQIELRGHTVELANITYGEDAGGDYSLLHVRSQQGDGGGAHDEDSLGTVKVYGDVVTTEDVKVTAGGVFDGIDILEPLEGLPIHIAGNDDANMISGTMKADNIHGEQGNDYVQAGEGDDFVFGGGHNDLLFGGNGNDWIEGDWGSDALFGENGEDTLVSNSGYDNMSGGQQADTFLFMDSSRGGQIFDWEDGLDKIDFSRMNAVQSMDDLEFIQLTESSAQIDFTNDSGKASSVGVIGFETFTLGTEDFIF